MPAGLELPRQELVVEHETRHFFANAQAFTRTVEVGVQDPVKRARLFQSPLIFFKMPVVEKPFTYGITQTLPP